MIARLATLATLATAVPAQRVVIDNLDAEFSSAQGGQVVVLLYHGTDAAHGHDPADFVAQMQHLVDGGFATVSLDDLVSWIQTGSPALPERPVALTFDDNYLSDYTVAHPAMQSRGLSGTTFAHTAHVGVPPGGPPPTSFDHADYSELAQMEAGGVFTVESHTVTHRDLTTLTAQELSQELVNSRADLEANLPGKTVRYLAYPFGAHDQTVIDATQSAGYVAAFTVIAGPNTRTTPLFELRRTEVSPSVPLSEFEAALAPSRAEGPWALSTSEPEFHGSNYTANEAGDGSESATWRFTPPVTGLWLVEEWHTDHANRASDAPLTVHHRDGSDTVTVDQRTGGGAWVPLGTFPFDAGTEWTVTLTDDADGHVIADALRFTSAGTVPVGLSLIGPE